MKKLTLIVAFISVVFLVSAQTDNYSSKSGKIVYQYELESDELIYTLVFDDFGKKQAFIISNKEGGVSHNMKTITTPSAMYIVNYEDKQVMKFPSGADGDAMNMYGGDEAGFDFSGMIAEISGDASDKIGTEIILGKSCDVYKYSDSDGSKGKYWVYKEYLLKAEFLDSEGLHTYMEVKELQIGINIDAKEFEVPTDFHVTDMTEVMQKMQQMQQMYGVPEDE